MGVEVVWSGKGKREGGGTMLGSEMSALEAWRSWVRAWCVMGMLVERRDWMIGLAVAVASRRESIASGFVV